jgi:hypothetical protein
MEGNNPNPQFWGRELGFQAKAFSVLSQQQSNESQRLIAENMLLGEAHNMQSEKFVDGSIFEVKLTTNSP